MLVMLVGLRVAEEPAAGDPVQSVGNCRSGHHDCDSKEHGRESCPASDENHWLQNRGMLLDHVPCLKYAPWRSAVEPDAAGR